MLYLLSLPNHVEIHEANRNSARGGRGSNVWLEIWLEQQDLAHIPHEEKHALMNIKVAVKFDECPSTFLGGMVSMKLNLYLMEYRHFKKSKRAKRAQDLGNPRCEILEYMLRIKIQRWPINSAKLFPLWIPNPRAAIISKIKKKYTAAELHSINFKNWTPMHLKLNILINYRQNN